MVTGGAGFLGRFVVEKLKVRGCSTIFVPRQSEFDLTDVNAIQRLYDAAKPTLVIHLAAVCGGIGANRAHPAEFFYKNLLMGTQLMHEAYVRRIPKFVAIGTICAYPKFTPSPFREEDLWNGYPEETNAPYGLAKKMLLVQAQAYRQQYNYNAIYLLPVNLYGPGDNFDLESSHVIPALVRKFTEAKQRGDKSVTCWGTGKVSREFLYVEDAAEAILRASEFYNDAGPVNVGSGAEIQISALAEHIKNLTGFTGEIIWDASKPDGQPARRLDTRKAQTSFGFSSQTTLEQGLQKTIRWYAENNSLNAPCARGLSALPANSVNALAGIGAARHSPGTPTARQPAAQQCLVALDIADRATVDKIFSAARPTVVFLCAALTAVDYCETHPDEARRTNIDGVNNVAEACRAAQATLVFLSTDYVFNGRSGPYAEDHETSPESVYGKTKLEGERIVLRVPKSIVVRTSVVHDWDPDGLNFAMQMIKRLGEGQPASVVSDQWSHPTLTRNLAEVLFELAELNAAGLFHVVGPDYVSRFDFAVELAKVFGFNVSLLTPVTTDTHRQQAPRPMQCDLKTDKVRALIKTPLIGIHAGLELIRKDYASRLVA